MIKFISLSILVMSAHTLANTKYDPHVPLSHCYHWLNEGSSRYLTHKYHYANQNNGDITFYTSGGNGAVAGPGLYCGKTPADSYGYGDRVIRIDFVDDVVLYDSLGGQQYCGHKGNFYASSYECQKKPWDVKFYSGGGIGNFAWYVIRNPQAVARWSANSSKLISDFNANKQVENGSFQIHADTTIRLINAEVKRIGEKIIENHNARLSIVKILKDQNLLQATPPLTVIALVSSYKGAEIPSANRPQIYAEQMKRALRDTKLLFDDFTAIMKNNQEIEAAFVGEVKNGLNQLNEVNPVVVLQGVDQFDNVISVSPSLAKNLWNAALLSAGDLQSLVDSKLRPDGIMANAFESSLPMTDDLEKVAPYNSISLLKILNLYVQEGSGKNVKSVIKKILKGVFIKSPSDFISLYDGIDNVKIHKETYLEAFVIESFKAKLETDPVLLGLAIDRLSNALTAAQVKSFQKQILHAPLGFSLVNSFKVLDDYHDGKLVLPKFYPEKLFFHKLLDRAIAERTSFKSPTNIFRMVFSGYFYIFNSRVKSEKDAAKRDQLVVDAAEFFLEFASSMTTPEKEEYRYIALQNALYFQGGMKYKNHPLDNLFASYQTGNVSLDTFFETAIPAAYDGSVMQYLIYNSADPKVEHLLKLKVAHLLSTDFTVKLASKAFLASQDEKKQWNNLINSPHYADKRGRVSSDVCYLVSVVQKFQKDLAKRLSMKQSRDLKTWAEDMKANYCK